MPRTPVPVIMHVVDEAARARGITGDAQLARTIGWTMPRLRAVRRGARPTVFELRSCEDLLTPRALARLREAYPDMVLYRPRPAVRRRPAARPPRYQPRQTRGRLAAQSDVLESLRQLEAHAQVCSDAVAAHGDIDKTLSTVLDTQNTVTGLRVQVRRWRKLMRQQVREVLRVCRATSDRLANHRRLLDESNAINMAEIVSLNEQLAEARSRVRSRASTTQTQVRPRIG
jgi:hypothetical protein